MYSRLDPLVTTSEIGLDDYVASLAARHAGLEKKIQDEAGRPAPDGLSLTALKRRKLHVKDEIVRVMADRSQPARRSRA